MQAWQDILAELKRQKLEALNSWTNEEEEEATEEELCDDDDDRCGEDAGGPGNSWRSWQTPTEGWWEREKPAPSKSAKQRLLDYKDALRCNPQWSEKMLWSMGKEVPL